ncbi:phage portal protein [Prevotella koreensis]
MDLKKFFGFEKRSTEGLKYISNFSEALSFAPFMHNSSAMNLSAVYRATEIISDSIAMLPIKIQQLNKENGKTEIENHPLKNVFGNKNNGNILTKFTLMKLLIQSVILKGNGFVHIERADDGTVKKLRYLEAQDVIINWDKFSNKLYYSVPLFNSQKKTRIEPINMIHLIKNTYDGVNGQSVLSYANRTLKTSNATEESAKSFFDNGMNLSGVLTVQGQLTNKQKDDIRTSWKQAYSNGGQGLAVLQGNMNYVPIQINAKDAQMLESRQFNIQDIARFFSISPVLLGDSSPTSYNSLETIQNEFLIHTLQPYITMVENEFNRKLIKPSEIDLNIILETNEILRIDKSAQANYYSTMLKNGIMSINEIRKELGFNPIKEGSKFIIPFTDLTQNTLEKERDNKENKK